MVLGMKTKGRRSTTIQVDFLVHIQHIKPWPPSKVLKSVKSVVLQWINGAHNFGSYASDVVNGEIGFGETFKLPAILHSDGKNKKRDKYPNNYLEFGLYEPPTDNGAKHTLLGSVSINLAEYAYSKETVGLSCPVYFHKSSRGSVQPILYVNLQPVSADNSESSSHTSFSKDISLDKDGSQFINEIMSNEDDVGIASFTDEDDTSSHSSQVTLSASEASVRPGKRSEQNLSELTRDGQKISEGSDPYPRVKTFEPEASRMTEVNYPIVNDQQTMIERTSEVYNNTGLVNEDDRGEHDNGLGKQKLEEKKHLEAQFLREKQVSPNNIPPRYTRGSSSVHRITPNQKLKHMKSVQFPFNSAWSTGAANGREIAEASSENPPSTTNVEYESRINLLEEELRESAAVEIGLYSVVAEHGSSTSKVHAPARRLSRFYIHTWKKGSASRRASAARAIVSGLVLVSKACGNDVARLTFWLSNAILLRVIVSRRVEGQMSYSRSHTKNNIKGMDANGRLPGAWFPQSKPKSNGSNVDDWEDPKAFTFALEKFEGWVFSRVVESVWWQSLTPNMQTAAAKGSNLRKASVMRHGVGDQAQGNFSIDLWKKAFKDAWERLCPIRAGGHECGCLSLMAKNVMEQLVARLDVAMLNAVLRESADEMPTDPISDPISDSKVLPIPAGKSSFGAGAQLKNAIGSWSRWLSDLFDIEDSEPSGEEHSHADQQLDDEKPFKPFRLLNELSDLMMLPAEMLAERTTRKEVCPTFGAPLIKIVLYNFVPDEFNPDPIPESTFETLDSEDSPESNDEDSLTCFPVGAVPLQYSPPTPLSLAKLIGELGNKKHSRNGSSVLKKSYTSDDELDELDSPAIASIMGDSPMPRSEGGRKVVRYQLLREIWSESK